ncbi:hypothetical protein HOLleu_14941 [Holothuria leucospilota]|uniref:arylamine N-acetyltransferase n=1 Tax=Holothuria leucospilota TaxID=206669 RepID=A0A9Q1C8C6_HOLLE|nr:hypothetical protein HOLleu_14941 [Holothuria leucospilota]
MAMSKLEAITFLNDVLDISTSSLRSGEPSLDLLNLIIKRFQHVIPFQSVSCCAVPPNQRRLPSWSDIKHDLLEKRGGLCYVIHVFMKELLSAVGYDAFYASADWKDADDHIGLVVQDMTGLGSKHLVEVASAFPVFQAIPLDFETESPEYVFSYLRQKFVRTTNGAVSWYHEMPPFSGCKTTSDGNWYKCLTIYVNTPRDLSFFEPRLTKWFTVEENNPFLRAPRAVKFDDGKLVAIKDKLLLEGSDRQVMKEQISNLQQLLQKYNDLFPQFPRHLIEDAVKYSFSSSYPS